MATITQTLRWGSKGSQVEILQTILNKKVSSNKLPDGKLKIDGAFGSKTYKAVKAFQGLHKRLNEPKKSLKIDGIVGENTRAVLNQYSTALPTVSLPTTRKIPVDAKTNKSKQTSVALHKKPLIQEAIKKECENKGKLSEYSELLNYIHRNITSDMKSIVYGIQSVENARLFARAYIQLRTYGLSLKEVTIIFSQVSKLKAKRFEKMLEVLAKPTGSIGRTLVKIAKPLGKVALIISFIQCLKFHNDGKYAAMMGEIYKTSIGLLIPWASYIDTFQSFLGAFLPESAQGYLAPLFKIAKIFNPLGLGAVAVESVAAVVTACYLYFIKNKSLASLSRLEELVKRMKKSSAATFVKSGEELGLFIYDLWTKPTFKSIATAVTCISPLYGGITGCLTKNVVGHAMRETEKKRRKQLEWERIFKSAQMQIKRSSKMRNKNFVITSALL